MKQSWCTISLLNLLHSSTCFEHYYAHLQEDLIVSIQHLVPDFITPRRWPFGAQVNLCTEQSPKERVTISGTRCCTSAICPPEDEHNSARNTYRNIINVLKNKEFLHQVGKKTIIALGSTVNKIFWKSL
jgi:hypothetical protein